MAKGRDTLSARIGLRVKGLRQRAGWTQTQLAERLRVEQQEISRLESGRVVNVNLDFADAIARQFQYTLADLLREVLPEPSLTAVEHDVLIALRGMDDETRGAVERLVRAKGRDAAHAAGRARDRAIPDQTATAGKRKRGTGTTP